ncbi:hypothetical protein [Acanthopleuribacter pedis]|uniref:Uncharacterized protein n=1 Tax=Acanthopleuribacter pedis TaxID=442870 RepID=A0A8J7U6I7_9BACT|nr:hypothetical protein [Acanthopleuribacter pedis]MBO1322817.1 hypothetical protein [Acanthopleuribacter pedis]
MNDNLLQLIREGVSVPVFKTEFLRVLVGDPEPIFAFLYQHLRERVTPTVTHVSGSLGSGFDAPRYQGPRSAVKDKLRAEMFFFHPSGLVEEAHCRFRYDRNSGRLVLIGLAFNSLADQLAEKTNQQRLEILLDQFQAVIDQVGASLKKGKRKPKEIWPLTEPFFEMQRTYQDDPAYQHTFFCFKVNQLINLWVTQLSDGAAFLRTQLTHPNPYAVDFAVVVLARIQPGFAMADIPKESLAGDVFIVRKLGFKVQRIHLMRSVFYRIHESPELGN